MKTIGLDVSLDVCKSEGYLMMQYDARKKFNPETEYRIFAYYPEYLRYGDELIVDTTANFNSLVELYKKHEKGINSSCETDKNVNFEHPSYYDFLNLASDINFYTSLP